MDGSQTRQSTDRGSVLVGHFHQFGNGFHELVHLAVSRFDTAVIRFDTAVIRFDTAVIRFDTAVIRFDTVGIRLQRMKQQLKVHRQSV